MLSLDGQFLVWEELTKQACVFLGGKKRVPGELRKGQNVLRGRQEV